MTKEELRKKEAELMAKKKFLSQQLSQVGTDLHMVQEGLKNLDKAPKISDHALIRYMERKCDISFEAMRKKIMTPETIAAIKAGAKKVKVDDLELIVSDDKVIVTIY